MPMDAFGLAPFMKIHEAWPKNGTELADSFSKLAAELQTAVVGELCTLVESKFVAGQKHPQEFLDGLVKSYSKILQEVHAAFGCWLKENVRGAPGECKKEDLFSCFPVSKFLSTFSLCNFFWADSTFIQKIISVDGESASKDFER